MEPLLFMFHQILTLTKDQLAVFFASLWAAVDGGALSTLEKASSSAAFLSAALECVMFLVSQVQRGATNSNEAESKAEVSTSEPVDEQTMSLVREQTSEVWSALEQGRLAVKDEDAGVELARFVMRLGKVHVGASLPIGWIAPFR